MVLNDAAEEGSRSRRKSLSPAELKEALQLVQIHMARIKVDQLKQKEMLIEKQNNSIGELI